MVHLLRDLVRGQRGLDGQKQQGQEAVGIMEEAMFLAQLVAEGEWAPAVVVVEEVEAAEGEAAGEEEVVVVEEAEAEAVS